jgi:hypothetical protein
MRQFLFFFTNERWDDRIEQVFDGHVLPRYQCTVREDSWLRCWDALQAPFNKMCAAYRRILGGKSAPHIRFGVPPRLLDGKVPEEPAKVQQAEEEEIPQLPARSYASSKEKPPIDPVMMPMFNWVLPQDLQNFDLQNFANPAAFPLDPVGPTKQHVNVPVGYNWNFLLQPMPVGMRVE